MSPKRGGGRPDGGAYRSQGTGRIVPSVSAIKDCWGEPDGLCHWSARLAVIAAVKAGVMPEDLPDKELGLRGTAAFWEAVKTGEAVRDNAGVHGTYVHEIVEAIWHGESTTGLYPTDPSELVDVSLGVRRVLDWHDDLGAHLEPIWTELPMEGKAVGGTADWIYRDTRSGGVIIGDLKTGKSPREEWALQLGAYSALYEATQGESVEAAFALHVPREFPEQKARAYWLPNPEAIALARRAFTRLLGAFHDLEQIRPQFGQKPRIKDHGQSAA